MTTRNIIAAVAIATLTFGCGSIDELMDKGDYDRAISKSGDKLEGKKKKKVKYVKSLEEAFEKATRKDLQRIEFLTDRGASRDWEEVIEIARKMERRQSMVEPYLPLIDEDGNQASFRFVKVDQILESAHDNVSQELYAEGNRNLVRGREGDKMAARNAYEAYSKLMEYTDRYNDDFELRNEARDLGINKVLIIQDNEANAWIPDYVAQRLISSFPISDDFWTKFYFPGDSVNVDIEARLILTKVEVGPESVRKEEDRETKRIRDGWDYVLDRNGNVAKDTLGNDIRIQRYRNVAATIVRTHQEKASTVTAQFEVRDASTGQLLASKPLHGEARFYHRAQWYYGDVRALKNRERKYIDLKPFPSDEKLLIEAAEAVKPLFVRELKRNYYATT